MMRSLIIFVGLLALAACSDDADRARLVDQSDASILDAAGDASTTVDTIDTPDTHDTPDASQDADPPQADAAHDVEQIPDVIPDIDESEPELPGNEDVCECTTVGPCCDGCFFLGADTVCETFEDRRDFCSNPGTCGNARVFQELQSRCTGDSPDCGESDWYTYEVVNECGPRQICQYDAQSDLHMCEFADLCD